MKTYVHLWYLGAFFLEWEIFQTKVVEKIKTHILCSITSSRKWCRLWDNVERNGRIRNKQITIKHLLSYLLTPWRRVPLEKLTGFQLVKKFFAFYGTQKFITTFTSAHHLSLSWASSIQSIFPRPTPWRFILILCSHLRLGFQVVSFPQISPTDPVYASPIPHMCYIPCT